MFPQVVVDASHPNHATLQSFVVAIYVGRHPQAVAYHAHIPQEIGCLIGALSNLWLGDRLGRRKTIVIGGCIMVVGAILQTTSYSYAQLVVARIVTGLGNGLNVGHAPHPLRPLRRLTDYVDLDGAELSRRVFAGCQEREFDHDRRQSYHVWNHDIVRRIVWCSLDNL